MMIDGKFLAVLITATCILCTLPLSAAAANDVFVFEDPLKYNITNNYPIMHGGEVGEITYQVILGADVDDIDINMGLIVGGGQLYPLDEVGLKISINELQYDIVIVTDGAILLRDDNAYLTVEDPESGEQIPVEVQFDVEVFENNDILNARLSTLGISEDVQNSYVISAVGDGVSFNILLPFSAVKSVWYLPNGNDNNINAFGQVQAEYFMRYFETIQQQQTYRVVSGYTELYNVVVRYMAQIENYPIIWVVAGIVFGSGVCLGVMGIIKYLYYERR